MESRVEIFGVWEREVGGTLYWRGVRYVT